MKNLFVLAFSLASVTAFAETPRPRVEFASATNGYATITGSLEQATSEPVGVSVQMGGLRYSTIADTDGKWGLVIKYTSTNYSVNSFSLTNSSDRSSAVESRVK